MGNRPMGIPVGGVMRGAAAKYSAAALMPEQYAAFAWQWFRSNQSVVVLSVKKWFLNVNITVGQLRPLFEMLFGPEV